MTRVAVIGLGEAGQKYLAALATIPGVDVVAVCDVDPARPADTTPSAGRYTDVETLLRCEHLDAVVVATPPLETLRIARLCAERGSVALAEKPVTLHSEALRRATREAWSRNVFVGFQTHFAPGVAALLGDSTLLSDPTLTATINLSWRRDQHYYRGWRCSRSSAGGVLHQQAIHSLALALRLVPAGDEIAQVAGTCVLRRAWKDVEDEVAAHVLFRSGRALVVAATVDALHPGEHSLLVEAASYGRVKITGRNLELGVQSEVADSGAMPLSGDDRPLRVALLHALLRHVSIGLSESSLYPLELLCRPLEVIDAIYSAAATTRA